MLTPRRAAEARTGRAGEVLPSKPSSVVVCVCGGMFEGRREQRMSRSQEKSRHVMSFELPIPHSGPRPDSLSDPSPSSSLQPRASGLESRGFLFFWRVARPECCKPTDLDHLPCLETANRFCWVVVVCVCLLWRCAGLGRGERKLSRAGTVQSSRSSRVSQSVIQSHKRPRSRVQHRDRRGMKQ